MIRRPQVGGGFPLFIIKSEVTSDTWPLSMHRCGAKAQDSPEPDQTKQSERQLLQAQSCLICLGDRLVAAAKNMAGCKPVNKFEQEPKRGTSSAHT